MSLVTEDVFVLDREGLEALGKELVHEIYVGRAGPWEHPFATSAAVCRYLSFLSGLGFAYRVADPTALGEFK